MSRRDVERERSTTWLRNTGVGREMLRLIQAKGAPVRRIFRQLAELGVPCSMTEELVGHKLADWSSATPKHEAKLQALWTLAEAYTDVANREPGAVEGLDAIIIDAMSMGIYYEPPSCAAHVIERRAQKVRRFTEDIEFPCRPGRTASHDRLRLQMLERVQETEGVIDPELARLVELRLELKTVSEIAGELRRAEPTIRKMLRTPGVKQAIEKHMPLADLEQAIALKVRAMKSESMKRAVASGKRKMPTFKGASGRPRKHGWDDAWVLQQLDNGVSIYSLAVDLGTSRQALTYRVKQARKQPPPP